MNKGIDFCQSITIGIIDMFGDVEEKLISDAIAAMEPGEFQVFCQAFLQICNPVLEGLRRPGGTPDGKTRKGTPDLQKDFANGDQIGVECSILQGYWQEPKALEGYSRWKPIQDLTECSKKLKQPIKVYLCNSQEIATNQQNAKNAIYIYAKDEFPFEIEILSNGDFINEISRNLPKYENVLKRCFPKYCDRLFPVSKTTAAEQVLKLHAEVNLPLDVLYEKVTEAKAKLGPSAAEEDIAAEVHKFEFEDRRSDYEIPFEPLEGIKRAATWDFFGGLPLGKVIAVRGVPKIGKTYLINQLCQEFEPDKFNLHWFAWPFSTPMQESDEMQFGIEKRTPNFGQSASGFKVMESAHLMPPVSVLALHRPRRASCC